MSALAEPDLDEMTLDPAAVTQDQQLLPAAQARAELAQLIRTVPKSYQQWAIGRTLEYKDAAKKATKLVENKSPRADFLNKALKHLRSFY